jgi:hypothetical protein
LHPVQIFDRTKKERVVSPINEGADEAFDVWAGHGSIAITNSIAFDFNKWLQPQHASRPGANDLRIGKVFGKGDGDIIGAN